MDESDVATLVPDDGQGWRLTCPEQARVAEANAYLGYLADRNYSLRTFRELRGRRSGVLPRGGVAGRNGG